MINCKLCNPLDRHYPISRIFHCCGDTFRSMTNSGSSELNESDADGHETEGEDQEPHNGHEKVWIANLRKVYGDFVAVNNLSMTLYQGEITVLLGENGAGKSTTMGMLTGSIPPSSGTVKIKNFDLRTELDEIRDRIGYCPQQNTLFSQLTPREHLQFFIQARGIEEPDVDSILRKMDLLSKADTPAGKLSGGQQRKLNLAIALSGNRKIVFLDEPTAGVDPYSRREIWNILQSSKEQCTMLMSTHFMDEADLLGDRVAILHTGHLKAIGSSMTLKKKFKSSYRLVSVLEMVP